MASSQGGMDIEAVAANTPDAIVTTPIDITVGLTNDTALDIAGKIGFEGDSQAKAAKEMVALYSLFTEVCVGVCVIVCVCGCGCACGVNMHQERHFLHPFVDVTKVVPSPCPLSQRDCTLVEINPMVQVANGDVKCLDAKLNFDDNAAFRQKEIFARRDITQVGGPLTRCRRRTSCSRTSPP